MILLIADSVCGGFGQIGKKSFIHYSMDELNIDVWDHSASGMSSLDYLDFCETGGKVSKEQYDLYDKNRKFEIVIISLGNVDCKGCYQKNNIFSYLVPPRYRKEKIDPRPYYSSKLIKSLFQHVDNYLRTLFRYFLYLSGNLTANIKKESMKINLGKIINDHDDKKIILVSTSFIDNKLFPGSKERFDELNSYLKSNENGRNIFYFDMRVDIERKHLMKDRFHLNYQGHQFVKDRFIIFFNDINSQ